MLRYTLSLLLLMVLCRGSKAQVIRFTDTTNVWKVAVDIPIDGMHYGELFSFRRTAHLDSLNFLQLYYPTLIRTDSTCNKVYYFTSETDTGNLLYDFTLAVGDTFVSRHAWHYVSAVDTLLIDGVIHRVWQFNWARSRVGEGGYSDYSVIEGIGCAFGPLFPIDPLQFERHTRLLCFWSRSATPTLSTPIYTFLGSFDNARSCREYYPALNIPTVSSKEISFPNPVTENTLLTIPDNISNGLLQIIGIDGKVLYSGRVEAGQQLPLGEIISIPGVYLYRLQDLNNGIMHRGKLVRE